MGARMKTSTIYFTAETVSRMTAAELVKFVGFLGDDASYRLRRELTSGPYAARIDATERRLTEETLDRYHALSEGAVHDHKGVKP